MITATQEEAAGGVLMSTSTVNACLYSRQYLLVTAQFRWSWKSNSHLYPNLNSVTFEDVKTNTYTIFTLDVNYIFCIKLCNCLESMAVFKIHVIHPFYSNSVIPHTERKKKKISTIIIHNLNCLYLGLGLSKKRNSFFILPQVEKKKDLKFPC